MALTARTIIAPSVCALVALFAGSAILFARAPTAPHMAPIPPIPPISDVGQAPLPSVPPPAAPAVPAPPGGPPDAPTKPVPGVSIAAGHRGDLPEIGASADREAMRRAMADVQNARRDAMKARAEAHIAAAEARRAALADHDGARRRMLQDQQLGLALNQARASIAAAQGMKDADRQFALERIDRALARLAVISSGR